jgi:hypothetical protein
VTLFILILGLPRIWADQRCWILDLPRVQWPGVQQIKASAGVALLRVWLAALVTPWVCALVLVFCGVTDRQRRRGQS